MKILEARVDDWSEWKSQGARSGGKDEACTAGAASAASRPCWTSLGHASTSGQGVLSGLCAHGLVKEKYKKKIYDREDMYKVEERNA